MCCASAKSLLRLVLIGGLVLFGGSARLMAEEAPAKADAAAASTSEAGAEEHQKIMVLVTAVITVIRLVFRWLGRPIWHCSR
jgi:hypothetical protein